MFCLCCIGSSFGTSAADGLGYSIVFTQWPQLLKASICLSICMYDVCLYVGGVTDNCRHNPNAHECWFKMQRRCTTAFKMDTVSCFESVHPTRFGVVLRVRGGKLCWLLNYCIFLVKWLLALWKCLCIADKESLSQWLKRMCACMRCRTWATFFWCVPSMHVCTQHLKALQWDNIFL